MEKFNSILKYSKGEVLLKLTDLNHIYKVPKTKLIKVKDWKKSKNITYLNLKKIFKSKVAVRSSAKDEDGKYESKAGRYESFLNVDINNKKIFFRNVDKVIESYSKSKSTNHDNQIIIQEMVKNIKSSGVVFTKDIENGTDYYVINYDDVTGKTNTVTSGSGSHANRILYIYKKSKDEIKSARFKKIIKFVQFLENYLKSDKIDIEFAINNNLDIYLFQVRLISTSKKWKKNYRSEIDKRINNEEKQIKKLFFSKKKILGSSTIFGIMPDWNPVEIIGKHPSLLSISLYKYLITDNTWSKARSRMGYRNLKKNKLMRIICGQPYIDTRLSLNSFLPSKLSTKIGKKIVDKGIFLLKKYPFFHDKIEFKISEPSFNFNSKKKVKELFQDVLTIKEQKIFVSELKNLTKKLIEEKGKFSIKYSISKILFLDKEFEKVKLNKTLANVNYLLKKCKSIGTLNFSILARHAFIAKSFLNSLVENKTLSLKDLSNFEQSLNSITTKMLEDSNLVFKKKKSINYFMKKYGHLRPGTYDLTSKRYDQMKNFKFNPTFKKSKNFNLSETQLNKIDLLLKNNDFEISAKDFIKYLKDALSLREYSKFVFTKYLSLILEKIAFIGRRYNFSRKEISHIDLKYFFNNKFLRYNKKYYSRILNKRIKEQNINKNIKLPALILDESNLRVIPYQVDIPNFITKKKVDGEILDLDKKVNIKHLSNKIIFIENADPGYDWIFAHKIKGLVTKFGGINSHMAIRCSELSIPAVIGCGEQIYLSLTKKKINHIYIDCSSSLIYSK